MKPVDRNYSCDAELYDKVILQVPGTDIYYALGSTDLHLLQKGERGCVRAARLKLGRCLSQVTKELVPVFIEARCLEDTLHRPATEFFTEITPDNLEDYKNLGMQGTDTHPFLVPSLHDHECPISNPARTQIERDMR